MIAASQSTTEIDANIAVLQLAITGQKSNVRSLSASVNLASVNTWASAASSSSTFDAAPTSGSSNAVRSGGVFSALASKQNTLNSSTDISTGNLTSTTLTTSSIDCSGGFAGNLITPSQTSITQLGTMNDLSIVSGTVDIVSPNFVVESANKRVGVSTASPQYAMDVTGNVNVNDPVGVLRINALPVLSSTALGNTVVDSNLTTLGALSELLVVGNVNIDSNTLRVDSVQNRVGIAQANPLYALDVYGTINLGTGNVFRVNGETVLGHTYLGNSITTSNLTTVGTLTGLSIDGDLMHTGDLTSMNDVQISNTLICDYDKTLSVNGRGTFFNFRTSNSHISTTDVLPQGGHAVWNSFNTGTGETDFVNKSGSSTGGFYFYNSSGSGSTFSTGKSLLASLTPESFVYDGFALYKVPVFKVIKRDGRNASDVADGVQVTAVTDTNLLIGDKTQIIYDNKNAWNRNDGVYIAPLDGYYRIDVYVRLQDDINASSYFAFKAEVLDGSNTILDTPVRQSDKAVFVVRSFSNSPGRNLGHFTSTVYMSSGHKLRLRCAVANASTIVHEVQLGGSLICI